jgi:hypothetical protein
LEGLLTDAEVLGAIEDRVRATLCETFGAKGKMIEGRISKDDFEALLDLINRLAIVETRRITDRFDAKIEGWNEALEHVAKKFDHELSRMSSHDIALILRGHKLPCGDERPPAESHLRVSSLPR